MKPMYMKTRCISLLAFVLAALCQYSNVAGQSPSPAVNTTGTRIKTLGTIDVVAKKPVIRQEADRIVYDIQADPESRSKSVLEMMRKVPLLSVDAGNNILLKGSSSYRIFINGKPCR